MTGEYRSGRICVKCSYPCLTCSSATKCTGTCGYLYGDSNSRIPTRTKVITNYYYGSHYYIDDCRCKSGYYHHAALKRCFKCIFPCITCSDSETC